MVAGIRRLLDRSAGRTVVDTPGWTTGTGALEMHEHAIEVVRPCVVVGLERTPGELDPALAPFLRRRDIQIVRLPASPDVRRRTPSMRQARREERFREHLAGSVVHRLAPPIHGPAAGGPAAGEPGRLVAILGGEGFVVALGVLLEIEPEGVAVAAPPFEASTAASVRLGSLRVDPATGESLPLRP